MRILSLFLLALASVSGAQKATPYRANSSMGELGAGDWYSLLEPQVPPSIPLPSVTLLAYRMPSDLLASDPQNATTPLAWTRVAYEGNTALLPIGTQARFGTGTTWHTFTVLASTPQPVAINYGNPLFGGDPAPGVGGKELDVAEGTVGVVVNPPTTTTGNSPTTPPPTVTTLPTPDLTHNGYLELRPPLDGKDRQVTTPPDPGGYRLALVNGAPYIWTNDGTVTGKLTPIPLVAPADPSTFPGCSQTNPSLPLFPAEKACHALTATAVVTVK